MNEYPTHLYRPDISDTCEQINMEKEQEFHFGVQNHKYTTAKKLGRKQKKSKIVRKLENGSLTCNYGWQD